MTKYNFKAGLGSKIIMKGGEAYKLLTYRQKICSDVTPLGFQVGGAR